MHYAFLMSVVSCVGHLATESGFSMNTSIGQEMGQVLNDGVPGSYLRSCSAQDRERDGRSTRSPCSATSEVKCLLFMISLRLIKVFVGVFRINCSLRTRREDRTCGTVLGLQSKRVVPSTQSRFTDICSAWAFLAPLRTRSASSESVSSVENTEAPRPSCAVLAHEAVRSGLLP